MNMVISEEEKREILSKYQENISNELLNYLKRHFPASEYKVDWLEEPIKQISIDYKTHPIKNNKKYLVGKLFHYVRDEWLNLDDKTIRRTIKKYIDGIRL